MYCYHWFSFAFPNEQKKEILNRKHNTKKCIYYLINFYICIFKPTRYMIRIYTHAYTYKYIYIFFVNYFARKKARESKKKT